MASTRDIELDQLLQAVNKLERYEFKDAASKKIAQSAARAVADKLARPFDRIIEMWGVPLKDAAIKTFIDLGLFKKWHEAGNVQSTTQLAHLGEVDIDLIRSLLKNLAAWNIVVEEDVDLYSQTEFSQQLIRPEGAAAVDFYFDCIISAAENMPSYLKTTKYVRPSDAAWAPHCYAQRFPGIFFEWSQQLHQQSTQNMNLCLKGFAEQRGSWLDVYPGESLFETADADQILVVDVGGGLGQDMHEYRVRFPEQTKGRLIVQDQADTIKMISQLDGVQLMTHDFFTPQPVQGARAYFIHQVLHDWPDQTCRTILKHIKPALAVNNNSRIFINEIVVPAKGASRETTSYDLVLMALLSAGERTQAQWRGLVEGAGLQIVNTWSNPAIAGSVLEVALQ